MPVPTRRLAIFVALGSAALLVARLPLAPGLLVVNGALLALAAVDVVLAPRPADLRLVRDHPSVLPLGGSGDMAWRVRNPSTWPVTVRVADEIPPSLRVADRRVTIRLGPRRSGRAAVAIRPARRGRFHFEKVAVRVEGPLGLAGRQRTLGTGSDLRVYPPFRSRKEAELRINKARILEVGLRSAKGRGGGTEFDQLREYTVDDEFTRIDWAATARADKPIVRTFRAERNQTVINLLDNGRVMAGRVDDIPRVEHAMDAVMMLTAVTTRLGDRTGLVAFDRSIRAVVPPGHGREQLGRVTEAMYELEPDLSESDYRGAFIQTMARFRKRSMLVIYTDLVEQAVGEFLLPALPLILRNHLVVVASVQDPDVVRWARERPADGTAAYRKAAAVAALAERERTALRLRRLGATVVDEPPGRVAPKLADAYLRVKATGGL